jgi:predicted aspartyl protease
MGTFSVPCRLANIIERSQSVSIDRILVDTGSEYTWVAGDLLEQIGVDREKKDLHFIMANGMQVTRSVGFAIVYVEDTFTIDEVVFAEPGDLQLLGARSLEGLNLTVDARLKKLVAAGPLPAAKTLGKPPQ